MGGGRSWPGHGPFHHAFELHATPLGRVWRGTERRTVCGSAPHLGKCACNVFRLRLLRCPGRQSAVALEPTPQANQCLPELDPPRARVRRARVRLEPAPARKPLINRGQPAKLFPNDMFVEVRVHGHLLSRVSGPSANVLAAAVALLRDALGCAPPSDVAPAKFRNPVMAHTLTPLHAP